MKKLFVVILIIITLPCLWGDIPWIPFYQGDLMGSIEGLLSLEHELSSGLTLGTWGGVAYVFTWVDNNYISTWGFEGAVETRYYFLGDIVRGIYFGGYFGYGLMRTPEYYRDTKIDDIWINGFSGGLKLGGRIPLNKFKRGSLLLEPYVTLSWVQNSEYSKETVSLFTLGIRFLRNWRI